MAKKRRRISAKEKAKAAIAALKEQQTMTELSSQFSVHSTQIHAWKKKLVDSAAEVFERGFTSSREREFQQRESELFEEVGRLKMELEWLKKKLNVSTESLRCLVDSNHAISITRQCELLGLPRSTYYFEPAHESPENLELMRLIDSHHLEHPHTGKLKMTQWLKLQGHHVNIKRVRRLMNLMGITAIYRPPRTTVGCAEHTVYPYLLRGVAIDRINQVWSTDITYLPMARGFMYLAAVIDWYSREVLSWEISNSLESTFCIDALEKAFDSGSALPEIFNTDQGSQFTSQRFTSLLLDKKIKISMDGKGRAIDNVIIERFWRSLKYEDIYLKEYETVADLIDGLTHYMNYYSNERPHQSLQGQTPASVYRQVA